MDGSMQILKILTVSISILETQNIQQIVTSPMPTPLTGHYEAKIFYLVSQIY